MDGPLDLSVAIMCKNNQDTIRRTLESLAPLASEIVAVDSGSTDGTIDILNEFNARVERREWRGYVETCALSMELCTRAWVLSVDSDESADETLAAGIRRALANPPDDIAGYRVNRKIWYRGRYLQHAWQPEWRLRLVRRSLIPGAIRCIGVEPHPDIDWVNRDPALRIADLPGNLRHDTIRDLPDFLAHQIRLATRAAAALHDQGVTTSRLRTVTSPTGALLKQLVLKQAWRDGWRGWVAAGSAALGTLAKHLILLDHARLAESTPPAEYDPPTRPSPNSQSAAPASGPGPSARST